MESKSPALEQAWNHYYRTLNEMRAAIEATPRFKERPEHRAQACYSLMEAQAMAYNMVIAPRLNHPRIYSSTSWNTYLYTLGQSAPDSRYGFLLLDGRQTYRLHGRLGEVRIALMQVYSHMLGQADAKSIGNHDLSTFSLKPDGTLEVILSAAKHEGNWIPLHPKSSTNFILLRRFHGDWNDDMGELNIEMLGKLEGYDEASEAALAQRIEIAAQFIAYLVSEWTIGLYDMYIAKAGGKNKFTYIGGGTISETGGSPSTSYGLAVADCGADDAIIVEQDVPDSAYWSFQLGDVWSKSLDFMHNQTDINMRRAVIDSDGRFRAVIAQKDPGVANWMDPMGRTEVTVVSRNYREIGSIGAPTMKTVKFSELRKHLPDDTRAITPEQRRKDLEYRRKGYVRLYD